MSTKKSKAPNHGVTGLSISQEEVDLFLDYLVESEPEQAKVHENAKETANTDIRDAEIHYIDAKEDRLYRILNKIAVSANKYFNYAINGIETAQIIHYKAPSNGYGYHIDIGPEGGTVLDPFAGSGTTGIVAVNHNRHAVMCELNKEYIELAKKRIREDAGMYAKVYED